MTDGQAVDVGFYHCTRRPATEVAVQLVGKAREADARVLLLAADDLLDEVDDRLWTLVPESFLAHGRTGDGHEEAQPVLLGTCADVAPLNGATFLMLVGCGLPPEFATFGRVFLLFDDGTPAHAAARADWKALADQTGVTRSYWQQQSSGWKRQLVD